MADLKASNADAELKRLRRSFKQHTDNVAGFIASLEMAMKMPESDRRGSTIARLCNQLEGANDSFRRFSLDLDFDGKPLKRARKIR